MQKNITHRNTYKRRGSDSAKKIYIKKIYFLNIFFYYSLMVNTLETKLDLHLNISFKEPLIFTLSSTDVYWTLSTVDLYSIILI